jgi:hypothetical protein
MKAGSITLLTGEGRTGGGVARVPTLLEVGDRECVGERKVREQRGGVADEKGEGVSHA